MGWPDKEQITKAVLDMLTINLGLKAGEKLLKEPCWPKPSLRSL